MTPIQMREALESRELLDAAEGPGVYAIRVAVPHSVEAVQRRWLSRNDHPLPDGYASQLANATEAEYVGASKHVRERLMSHAESNVRKASFVSTFELEGVAGVWPTETAAGAFQNEYRKAIARSAGYRAVWCDGDLL